MKLINKYSEESFIHTKYIALTYHFKQALISRDVTHTYFSFECVNFFLIWIWFIFIYIMHIYSL